MTFYCILHKKYTVADCLVPEKAHMFSTKSDFCSIVYAFYIWRRIERQPQQLLLYKGLVAGMMTEEWLTADIMLEEQLCRYRYRGVHN